MTDLTGQTIGKYRIVAQLGRGGMAQVYKAYQPGLDRYVALKVLRSHLADDRDFIGRFEREAAAVARLRHPNIVQVYDFDVEGDQYYMVMEYVEGPTLKAELKERSIHGQFFTLPETARIFDALVSAIDYAHSRGMVHRDLKPANIMFTNDGQAVLTDFGIARMMGDTDITVTGQIMGTPAYMSPEQGQGERGDERSDIYSLGVILYEMVTGRVPFEADTPFAIIMKHIGDPLPPPSAINPLVMEAVEQVICRALRKDPDDRYQTASEMAQALRQGVGVTPEQKLATMPITTIAPTPRIQELPVEVPSDVTPDRDKVLAPHPTQIDSVAGTGAVPQAAPAPARTPAPRPVTWWPISGLPILPLAIGAGAIVVVCLIVLAVIGIRALVPGEPTGVAVNVIPTAHTVTLPAQSVDSPAPPTTVPTSTDTPPAPTSTPLVAVVTHTSLPASSTPRPMPATHAPSPAPPTPTLTPTLTPSPTEVATPTTTQPIATPTPRAPSFAGKLAFSLTQGTNYKVYVVEVGPTPPTSLYASIGNARQPALSHDGQWLLVNGTGGGIDAIARLTSNGHQASPITCPATTAESHRPAWSPDDRLLAFDGLQVDPGRPQIYIQRADEVDCELVDNRLHLGAGYLTDPNGLYPLWGPDDRIYFRSCATWDPSGASTCGIWSVRSDGSDVQRLTDNPNHLPTDVNRDRLLFMSSQEGNWEVYSVSLRAGTPQNLTNHPGTEVWGALSPDGRSIAFMSNRSGRWAIWLASVDGRNPQEWLPINTDWGEIDPARIAQERMSWSR